MAFQTGTQVNAALGRTDYTPFLQGALQGAQAQGRGAENIAQGLAGLGKEVAKGMASDVEQKKMEKTMLGTIDSAGKLSTALAGLMAIKDEKGNAVLDPRIAKSLEGVNEIIANKDGRSTEERFAAAQTLLSQGPTLMNAGLKFYDLQSGIAEKKAISAQKTTDSQALGAAMAPYLPGKAPAAIARPAAKFDPGQFLADYTNNGGSLDGLQKSDQIVKMLGAKDGAKLTTAMQNTQAIVSAEIASGKLDATDKKAVDVRTATLLAQGGADRPTQDYIPGAAYVDEKHQFLGNAVFNQKTGFTKLIDIKTGKIIDLPPNARPSTVSQLSNTQLPPMQFLALRKQVLEDEISLGKLSTYMKSVGDANQGIALLADKFSANMSTLFSSGVLDAKKFAAVKSEAELQGLIGENRLGTVGGGTMTEQDALRVIIRLGGNANAFRNKQKVAQAISDVYNDKYKMYRSNLESHNIQQGMYYKNYSEAAAIPIDESLIPKRIPDVDIAVLLAEKKALEEKRDKK
jgi:hypothetical protein